MVRLEEERNIEVLRQTALLLAAENERLHRRLVELTRSLAHARGQEATQLELEIRWLEEKLAAQTRQIFAASSETRPRPRQPSDEQSPAPRCGHGPRVQAELPMVEALHTVDEPDRMCPKCGGHTEPWEGQCEESEEIDVVERSFRVVKHKREKRRCGCGHIETAIGPPKLIPGGRYSIGFAVEVAVAKYTDHLPLARQVRQMARAGLLVDTQTLWDQLWALGRRLEPTYQALFAYVLEAPVVGADETTWRLMEKRESRQWWAWVVSRPDALCYRILPSRSAKAAAVVLGQYRGIVIADGYSAYRTLQKELAAEGTHGSFTLACCMAHARRKFVDAEPDYPQTAELLDLIGQLYEIERRARQLPEPKRLPALARLRHTESRPLTEQIRRWLNTQAVLPRSSLGRAIAYTRELWPGLTLFLDNPAIPIDNNHSERGMRAVALGRKNHYGSRSLRGTEVAALFYSLIESAKLAGLEPAAYLREATRRAINKPGTVTLPCQLVAERCDTS